MVKSFLLVLFWLGICTTDSARVIQKTYAIGDTNCAGSKTFESTPFLVAEVDGNEGCVNLDVAPADGLAESSVRNRWCDQSFRKYHISKFSEPGCVCMSGSCDKVYPLDVCYMDGQVPTITTCDQWSVTLPQSATTVLNLSVVTQNITNHNVVDNTSTYVTNVTNVTNVTMHVTNVTNVTNVTYNVTEIHPGIVQNITEITEQLEWGPSAYYGALAAFVLIVGILAYTFYKCWEKNKEDEKTLGKAKNYLLGKQLKERRPRIF